MDSAAKFSSRMLTWIGYQKHRSIGDTVWTLEKPMQRCDCTLKLQNTKRHLLVVCNGKVLKKIRLGF
ncbi:hypothetical protein EG68_11715 [Paragonimus skrjabini miyazakii]|uniref:Uncharacterized protein n=1 Tax=Paragonimus skrjabini miyazakii TaxID=59628 RepID=A0A8S9YE49_9TREM|nr:hypothetical protein EG68_11715 [Paragonimus skrjabini miyazakii]